MRPRLLIVGASGRAAAASAIRAGFDPFVIDLFADADTQRLCPVLKCDPADYPHGFIPLAEQAPASPWMYTGGLENHPEVVEAISQKRELFGFGPDQLKGMRDPFRLSEFVMHLPNGRSCNIRAGNDPPPVGEPWLRKPLRSSGGFGIRFTEPNEPKSDTHYFQEFIAGESHSLLMDGQRILGTTRQLMGTPWLHASAFRYAGNAFHPNKPFADSGETSSPWLSKSWGIDFIATGSGNVLIEINPRYTAAMELLEMPCDGFIAKAIYFAPHAFAFPESGPWEDSLARCTEVWKLHDFADIPYPFAHIEAGQPVITIFTQGDTEADCLESLQRRAAELDRLFGWENSP